MRRVRARLRWHWSTIAVVGVAFVVGLAVDGLFPPGHIAKWVVGGLLGAAVVLAGDLNEFRRRDAAAEARHQQWMADHPVDRR